MSKTLYRHAWRCITSEGVARQCDIEDIGAYPAHLCSNFWTKMKQEPECHRIASMSVALSVTVNSPSLAAASSPASGFIFRFDGNKKENTFFSSIFHAFKSDHVATSAKVQSCLKLARSNDCGGAFESLLQAMPFFKCFWLDTAARCFLDTFFLAAENLDGRIFDPGMEAWKVGSCQPSGKEKRKKLDAANASGQQWACGVHPHAKVHEWISWENHINI